MAGKGCDPARTFFNSLFNTDGSVKVPGLLPKRLCVRTFSRVLLEDRIAANRIGQIEIWNLFVMTIKFQRLAIIAISRGWLTHMPLNICDVANRVRQLQNIVQLSKSCHGFLIVI